MPDLHPAVATTPVGERRSSPACGAELGDPPALRQIAAGRRFVANLVTNGRWAAMWQ